MKSFPKAATRIPSLAKWALALSMASTSFMAGAHDPAKPDDPMTSSKSEMATMSMTGDADYDFASNMRMHHQKALDMADKEIQDGKSPEMVKMAKQIKTSQTKEIAQFDAWLKKHKEPAAGQSMP